MKWYLNCFKNYTRFSGRAGRTEFWMFYLFDAIASSIIFGLDMVLGVFLQMPIPILSLIYFMGSILPYLAVSVRRLHDSGKSGWWYLISLVPFGGIVLIVFFCLESQHDENQYGPEPGTEYPAA